MCQRTRPTFNNFNFNFSTSLPVTAASNSVICHYAHLTPYTVLPSRSSRLGALFTMDVVAAVSGYMSKMVTAGESASGSSSKMKILLLDSETVGDALCSMITGDDN